MSRIPLDLLMPFVSAVEDVHATHGVKLRRTAITVTGPDETSPGTTVIVGIAGAVDGSLILRSSWMDSESLHQTLQSVVRHARNTLSGSRYRFDSTMGVIVQESGRSPVLKSTARQQTIAFEAKEGRCSLTLVLV